MLLLKMVLLNNTRNNDNHANHRNDDDLDEIQVESMKFNEIPWKENIVNS